ncbi:hypothetical protein HMPREF0880_03093 [Yokenella regensburgei ATCC 43003]|nr:hypothetical protein HMPREF0880_03093 [Yokenella regensburgei ATCC 43003]
MTHLLCPGIHRQPLAISTIRYTKPSYILPLLSIYIKKLTLRVELKHR